VEGEGWWVCRWLRIREGLVESGGSRFLELRLRDRYRDGPTKKIGITIAAVYWIE